jgi:dTDP-4-dehydrorhamnose reductase
MLDGSAKIQVNDRFFSPVFAFDAADILWEISERGLPKPGTITHVGNPVSSSRYSLAKDLVSVSEGELETEFQAVSYKYFLSDVKRPADTTWDKDSTVYKTEYLEGLQKCYLQWKEINRDDRAKS